MKSRKKTRKPQFGFEVNPLLLDEAKQVAQILEIPVAQIGRDGLRERIAFLRQTDPRLKPAEVPA